MPFIDTPASTGDDWKPNDHLGALVFCEYYEFAPGIKTKFGVLPGVRVLVTVIESDNRSEVGQTFDTMFFNASLVRTGRKCLDKGKFLGRLGQQEFTNGTGIVMLPPTDADKDTALRFERWLSEQQGGAGTSVAGQGQAAAPPRPAGDTQASPPPQPRTAPSGGGTYTDGPPF